MDDIDIINKRLHANLLDAWASNDCLRANVGIAHHSGFIAGMTLFAKRLMDSSAVDNAEVVAVARSFGIILD